MNNQEKRKRCRVSYVEKKEVDIWNQGTTVWQEDWTSDDDEEMQPSRENNVERQQKKNKTTQQIDDKVEVDTVEEQYTEEERQTELHNFMQQQRNKNTTAAYAAAWKGFKKWIVEIENKKRREGEKVNIQKPTEIAIAGYMRYIVEEKDGAISTVKMAVNAIADKLKYVTNHEYDPCRSKTVKQMERILASLTKDVMQKKEVQWEQVRRIIAAI